MPTRPSKESNPGPLAFRAIPLPVKLLGQVRLRPNHGATFYLSSRKNKKIAIDPRFQKESTNVPGRPTQWNHLKLEKVGVCGENIFREHSG